MKSYILACPHCRKSYRLSGSESELPEQLHCPGCGQAYSYADFAVESLCPNCHELLTIPAAFFLRSQPFGCSNCHHEFVPQFAEVNVASTSALTDETSPENEVLKTILQPGDFFDKYRIIKFLGQGGMGEVYLAEHLLLQRQCALKVLKKFPGSEERIFKKRFLREAQIAQRLNHPNIVNIYEVGCQQPDGYLFIAMEYINGGTLAEQASGGIPEKELLQIAAAVTDALIVLEQHHIVHRDIKPANIMRSQKGAIKLMDLGIAKSDSNSLAVNYTLTMLNAIVGTPAYASPEQCRNSHETDSRSDIYSLGATLYHLACGHPPFDEKAPPVEIIAQVLQDKPQPLSQRCLGYSRPTLMLIELMMQKNPGLRPKNAVQLAQMIQAIQTGKFMRLYAWRGVRAWCRPLVKYGLTGTLIAVALYSWLLPNSGGKLRPDYPEKTANTGVRERFPYSERSDNFTASFLPSIRTPQSLIERENSTSQMVNHLRYAQDDLPFKDERLNFFAHRREFLHRLIQKKRAYRAQARHPELTPAMRKLLHKCLEAHNLTSWERKKLLHQLILAIRHKKIDPDTRLVDLWGEKRSLLGLVLEGGLFDYDVNLLKTLILAGADIDADPGPRIVRSGDEQQRQNTKVLNLVAELIYAGRDMIDFYQNNSLIMTCFYPGNIVENVAAHRGQYPWKLIEFLIDSGCLVDVTDDHGRTPVHFAAMCNQPRVLEKLLLSGVVTPGKPDRHGNTPYHHAVRNDAEESMAVLRKFGLAFPVTERDWAQGQLLAAIQKSDIPQAEMALHNGAKLPFVYYNNLNALQNAVLLGSAKMTQWLLEHQANIYWNQHEVCTLDLAITRGQIAIFELLIKHGRIRDWNFQTRYGQIYLPHRIIKLYCHQPQRCIEFLKVLLAHGWDINEWNQGSTWQMTALQYALQTKKIYPVPPYPLIKYPTWNVVQPLEVKDLGTHTDIIRFLLEHQANPYLRNPNNQNAFDVVRRYQHQMLLQNYVDTCWKAPEHVYRYLQVKDFDQWQKPPHPAWGMHYGRAFLQAKKTGKKVLIFTFRSKYFPQFLLDEQYLAELKKDFELVFFDIDQKNMCESQKTHILSVRKMFKTANFWPSTIVLAPDFTYIGRIIAFNNHTKEMFPKLVKLANRREKLIYDSNNVFVKSEKFPDSGAAASAAPGRGRQSKI